MNLCGPGTIAAFLFKARLGLGKAVAAQGCRAEAKKLFQDIRGGADLAWRLEIEPGIPCL